MRILLEILFIKYGFITIGFPLSVFATRIVKRHNMANGWAKEPENQKENDV